MSQKVLTLSVAAYQMEKYIEQTLASVCVDEIIDKLEIFVVDDGGTDRTMELARPFAEKYPDSVFLVHKENGGYGSTVNLSASKATGKYFKLLDGDDWVDPEGLKQLVQVMETSSVDLLMTNFTQGTDPEHSKRVCVFEKEGGEIRKLSEYKATWDFCMWSMAVRTEVFRANFRAFPEHRLYTDTFYVCYPLAQAKTIQYLNFPVYGYRTERNGQSMSKASIVRHSDDMVENIITLAEFAKEQQGNPNEPVIVRRVGEYYAGTIRFLMFHPASKQVLEKIKDLEQRIMEISPGVYKAAELGGKVGKMLSIMRKTGYHPYWLLKLRRD